METDEIIIPGSVIVPLGNDGRNSPTSVKSNLSQIPTTELLEELRDRLVVGANDIEENPEQEATKPEAEGCTLYVFVRNQLKRIKPYALPVIFIGGTTTILADAISYAGEKRPEIAATLALAAMVTGSSIAVIFGICRYCHYKRLRKNQGL